MIDFESEPLRSADLFSIVGETGSGKSTILDAVCLALYGLAPRFYGADNFDYYHTERRITMVLVLTTRVTFFARVRRSVLPKWCFWRATVSAIVPAGRVP